MNIETPTTILVKRRAALGDVVMTTGLVRELHKKHEGKCAITVATDHPIVYKNNPYIVDLRNFDEVNANDYDVVYNLDDAYEANPDNHYVSSMFERVFGDRQSTMDRSHCLIANDEDKARVDADIKEIDSPFFAIHMRQWHWPLKNIDIDTWVDIISKVFEVRADHKIVLVGGPTDFALDHPLIFNANARYTPQQLAYLLNSAKCFVGIDSGPLAIAGASTTHIIGLLTHIKPEYIMPQRHLDPTWHWTAIQADVPCVGCNTKQKRPVRMIECDYGDFRCNRTWNTQQIADAILEQLK
jgi:ADP-heptose:LPS heptosyltransferase